jgi:hypothetical protein
VTHGATGKHGYKSEGVNFYVFLHHAEGLLPIYRYYNGKDHFYTANADEIGTTKIGEAGKGGYVHEGIMGFVSPNQFNGSIPIYRYFHPVSGDHFYTTLATEIGTTHEGQVGALGFKCEGILGYVSNHEFPGAHPILRYWNEQHHDHFYTVSAEDIGTTHVGHVAKHGYKYEGVVGFAYPAQHHVASVYRYWNEGNTDHFYTANSADIGTVTPGQTGNHGYTSEGTGFHIFTHHHQGLVPVYRYWHAGKGDHFYTSNAAEIGTIISGQAGNHGYVCEGVLGYVSPNEFWGGLPVYRYFKEGDGHDHFYTTDPNEIGTTHHGQVGKHGYKCEGIMGYVPHH